ncbi:hypothetical protein ACFFX0_21030 [Citricoccus parietis]|uniref:Uncharacterized protein n=1 Tax=Citricoccus parietis TaxID=592307 RepID=A0ABV5G3M7_9MICC
MAEQSTGRRRSSFTCQSFFHVLLTGSTRRGRRRQIVVIQLTGTLEWSDHLHYRCV